MAHHRAALIAALAAGVACSGREAASDKPSVPVLHFDTSRVRVASATDTAQLLVELAITDEQKTLGLMERRTLAPDAGMLFAYRTTQPESAAFWMFRTRIPLDIAFLDSTGTIRAIRAMQPCESPFAQACPTYAPGVPYRAALEVNPGYFARVRVKLGDRVMLEDTARSPRPAPPLAR
jgi:uncharacterized membrane protein (UPF0127 family)